MNVKLGKTKVMISSITKDGCSLRAKANSVWCVKFCKWIHGKFAVVKRVIDKCKNFACRKCYWNIGEAVEQG